MAANTTQEFMKSSGRHWATPFHDKELKHIWPTRHAHINVYGRYHFNRELFSKKQQLP